MAGTGKDRRGILQSGFPRRGTFCRSKEWLEKLFANGQVATQYVNEAGVPTMDEEWNVNGSYMAIEGITSPDGRVLGKMAHSDVVTGVWR